MMKALVVIVVLLTSSFVGAQEDIRLVMSESITQGQQNQLRYTLSQPMVREALEQTNFIVSNIVAVPADMEFANHVVGNTLFLSPGVSPLLVSEILSGPQHFLSADYLIDQRNQEIEDLTREMLEEVEQAESKDDVYDALVDYYDQLPTNSQKIDLNEYREKVAIVLADQSLQTIKKSALEARSEKAGKFILFFPVWRSLDSGGVFDFSLFFTRPLGLIIDFALLPVAILLLPITSAIF